MYDEDGPTSAARLRLFLARRWLRRDNGLDRPVFGMGEAGALDWRGMFGVVRSSCLQRS